MATPDPHYRNGHRNRLRKKFLDGKLTDYELLELLLTFAIPRRDVRELARALDTKYGNLFNVLTAPIDELVKISGIGENVAVFIKVIHEVMRINYQHHLEREPVFHNHTALVKYCQLLLHGKTVEEVHVLYLNDIYKLIGSDVHSVGTVDESAIYPREIIRGALAARARYVVLVHNHPSSDASFSQDDIVVTTELKKLLEMVGIGLYDHLVVSHGIVYSMRDQIPMGN